MTENFALFQSRTYKWGLNDRFHERRKELSSYFTQIPTAIQ